MILVVYENSCAKIHFKINSLSEDKARTINMEKSWVKGFKGQFNGIKSPYT